MSRASSPPAGAADLLEGSATDNGYLAVSSRPLMSLVFLLPFIILYEIGTTMLLTDVVQGKQDIVAFTLLQRFFALFGATGRHLPAFAAVAILLAWHLARRDRWSVSVPALIGMAVESIALGVPLIVFGLLLARLFPLSIPAGESLGQTIVLSLGAGVYEELVFRLIMCTGLAILFRNAMNLSHRTSLLLLVLLSATLFSAYHYLGTGHEVFHWRIFVFRLVAGVYFATLFLARGFGITAGSHMAYDILIVLR